MLALLSNVTGNLSEAFHDKKFAEWRQKMRYKRTVYIVSR